jgi:hypothetical protein
MSRFHMILDRDIWIFLVRWWGLTKLLLNTVEKAFGDRGRVCLEPWEASVDGMPSLPATETMAMPCLLSEVILLSYGVLGTNG